MSVELKKNDENVSNFIKHIMIYVILMNLRIPSK